MCSRRSFDGDHWNWSAGMEHLGVWQDLVGLSQADYPLIAKPGLSGAQSNWWLFRHKRTQPQEQG